MIRVTIAHCYTVVTAIVMSKPVKVSIVGTAGRKGDGKKMTKELYYLMYEKAKDVIINEFKLELSQCHVVSGGAAWAGRVYLLVMFKNSDLQYIIISIKLPYLLG